jgi:hypothetical protein
MTDEQPAPAPEPEPTDDEDEAADEADGVESKVSQPRADQGA